MIGLIWAIVMYGTVVLAIKKSWSQEDKVGKGLYVVLGILSTWAMYDIVIAFLK